MKNLDDQTGGRIKYVMGEKCVLRPLRIADAKAMALWPPFRSPRDASFNEPLRSKKDLESWIKLRNGIPEKETFAVLNKENVLVGRISLTLVDFPAKEGLIGIRIRADCVNKGYGSDSLVALCRYWFDIKGGELLTLDVSSLNPRAVCCYEKAGFRKVGYHYMFEPRNKHPNMSRTGYVKYYDMRMTKDDFRRLNDTKS